MTHDILQTDIELAKGLIGTNRPADEIAVALARRGIDLPMAIQLVDDLRNGRRVQPQMNAPEFVAVQRAGRRRSGTAQAERASDPQPSRPRVSRERRSRQPASAEHRGGAIVWFAGGVVGCLLFAAGVLAFKHWQRTESSRGLSPTQRLATAETGGSVRPAPGVSTPMALEIRSDGLYLDGALLTREAAWSSVVQVLGAPTRTNLAAGGNRLIYAYDRHGILVYGASGSGADSIVLDFEGLGGTNGAASPFRGSLRIDDHSIKGDTDSRALTAIKQLGLKEPRAADEGIFGGQYNGLDLIFAYWKTPQKLSMVEITLK